MYFFAREKYIKVFFLLFPGAFFDNNKNNTNKKGKVG